MKYNLFTSLIFTLFSCSTLLGAYSGGGGDSFPQQAMPKFPSAPDQTTPPPQPGAQPTGLKKEPLPVMRKPFGMPGVVGVINREWQNSDYLGYLSHNIPVTIELLSGKNVPHIDPGTVEKAIVAVLQNEGIINEPESRDGPIFPFLHFLIVVYAADNNRFVVFANIRLFEQVMVMRKGFSPAGFWQAVTWENQDVNITNANLLQTQVESSAVKLANLFANRYREYNKELNKSGDDLPPVPPQ